MNRAEKHAHAVFLLENGYDGKRAAAAMGLSYGGFRSILDDPTGSKQKARRERYRGICEQCGARTDGSSGYKAPRLCASCNGKRSRVWTRESIIAAIQAWAAEHGHPPRAQADWLNSKDGHPCASSVYGRNGPFESWADAIESAGFPRPNAGTRYKVEA